MRAVHQHRARHTSPEPSTQCITGGMNASYFVVGARTGDKGLGGISLFFVDEGTPGFERTPLERKMGWWASDQATLYCPASVVCVPRALSRHSLQTQRVHTISYAFRTSLLSAQVTPSVPRARSFLPSTVPYTLQL